MNWRQEDRLAADWARALECDLRPAMPVDVDLLCRQIGIHLRYRDMPLCLNAIYAPIQGRVFVIVNANHSPPRRRYAIVHEVAHLFIDLVCPNVRERRRERFCQIFAANVLMPAQPILGLVKNGMRGIPDVFRLARRFQVSRAAMQIRLQELALTEPPESMA